MEILSLGEKIKRRRKELDMTLKDLAADRITPGQISLVESGKSNPSMDLLEYLAQTLQTSIEYLMETEERQAEKICTYFENIAEAFILNEDLVSGEEYVEKSLYYAEKYSLEYKKAKNLYLRGCICRSKNESALAQQYFLSSNVIFIKNNNYEQTVNTFLNLGKITLELKAYYSACSYFEQAEKVYNENDIGNDFILGQIYYYISFSYYKLENIDKAINYSFLSKEKFKQLDNKKDYANALLLLSKQYSDKGEIDIAIKYSKKTLNIYKEIDDLENISEIENNLGKLFGNFENLEESFTHLNKARKMREENKDGKLTETLISICENYLKLRNIKMCNKVLDDIIDNLVDGDSRTQVKYYMLKYRVQTINGEVNEAESTLILAYNFAIGRDCVREAAEICIMLGKFYIEFGKETEAAKYLDEGVELFKKLGMIKQV